MHLPTPKHQLIEEPPFLPGPQTSPILQPQNPQEATLSLPCSGFSCPRDPLSPRRVTVTRPWIQSLWRWTVCRGWAPGLALSHPLPPLSFLLLSPGTLATPVRPTHTARSCHSLNHYPCPLKLYLPPEYSSLHTGKHRYAACSRCSMCAWQGEPETSVGHSGCQQQQ